MPAPTAVTSAEAQPVREGPRSISKTVEYRDGKTIERTEITYPDGSKTVNIIESAASPTAEATVLSVEPATNPDYIPNKTTDP